MASLRDNPVSNFIFGKGPSSQPGVGGPLRDMSHPLQQDPMTGYWFDPQTGTSYLDGQGTQPITNPNIAQQVAANYQHSQAFLGQLGGLDQQRNQVFNNQQGSVQDLQSVLTGRAPSLAGMQAQQFANEGANQQFSQAAGVGGASAPLAQMMAARNAATIQGQANNAATMGRVKEQTDARNSLIQLLASMGQGVQGATDTTSRNAVNYAQLASGGAGDQQNLNRQADKEKADQSFKLGGAGVNALASGLDI